EVFIGEWFADEGEWLDVDESIVGLETDKATFDVPAPVAGTLQNIRVKAGQTAQVGDLIAEIAEGPPPEGKGKAEAEDKSKQPAAAGKAAAAKPQASSTKTAPRDSGGDDRVMPAARRELANRGLAADQVRASGPGGRLL